MIGWPFRVRAPFGVVLLVVGSTTPPPEPDVDAGLAPAVEPEEDAGDERGTAVPIDGAPAGSTRVPLDAPDDEEPDEDDPEEDDGGGPLRDVACAAAGLAIAPITAAPSRQRVSRVIRDLPS